MKNEFLEQKIKELLYHFGEINWNILNTKAWDDYINNQESFNEKQFKDLRHFAYGIAEDFAIDFADWKNENCFQATRTTLWYIPESDEFTRAYTNKQLLEIYKKEKGL